MNKTRTKLLAAVTVFALALFAGGCLYYTRSTPDQVEDAILKSGVIGSSPEEAIVKLRSVRLSGERPLRVGQYSQERRRVTAAATNVRRTGFTLWNVNIIVSFDSTHRASDVDVKWSANNPM